MSLKSPARALRTKPDFSYEISAGGLVCGLDEVGRGPLAGPVVASCVHIQPEKREMDFVAHIRDSKKLSVENLEKLYGLITAHFVYGLAEVSPEEIDRINILQASLLAMRKAFDKISDVAIAHALVDGNRCPSLPCAATPVIKGDSLSVSIAAASIVAKVTRDRIMRALAAEHPHYGWERNVGYPTAEHIGAIGRHGITPHHRKTFAPVRDFIEFGAIKPNLRVAV